MSYNSQFLEFSCPHGLKNILHSEIKVFTKKGSKLRRLDSKAEENKNRFNRKGTNSTSLKPKPKQDDELLCFRDHKLK